MKLLGELAGAGLLVWGGERDNHGMCWRPRIRLLDPDLPPVHPEPWMRSRDPHNDDRDAGWRENGA